jgi:predicted ATPase
VVSQLLSVAPNVKVLATSRIPLRLYGEHEYSVPPLALPDLTQPSSLERLTQYEAIKLFMERAQAARADFSVTNENASAVAEICHRLDGLPLAIELAAARVKALSPQKLLERLSSRLKLLTGGARDLPERQRTLRNTIEWSYVLLDEGEEALFARLAVFSGGCTLGAIEAICDADGGLPVDLLDGVSSLVDKSLLRQEEGVGGEPRFVMLETIHEFAREKLWDSGEAEDLRRLHARYFLVLAEEAELILGRLEQGEWLERLETEHANMRAALSWLKQHGEAEPELKLAAALWPFWDARGYFGEARRWLEGALEKDEQVSAGVRAKALSAVSFLGTRQIDPDLTEAAAEEGLRLSAEAEIEGSHIASFKNLLGEVARVRSDPERAMQLFEEGLGLSREAGDKRGTALALRGLAILSWDQGDHERGKELHEEYLALCRELGDVHELASSLSLLGWVRLLEGDHERATTLNEEAVELLRKRGHRGGLQYALDNLGWAALAGGDYERAKGLWEESLALCRDFGDKLCAQGALEGLACSAAAKVEDERAARLFGSGEALYETLLYQESPQERALKEPYITATRSRLEETAWQEAWKEGRAMTIEEAISYALEEEEAGG